MNDIDGQINMFTYLAEEINSVQLRDNEPPEMLYKGDIIYRVILGEVETLVVDGSFIVNMDDDSKPFRGYNLTYVERNGHGVIWDRSIGIYAFQDKAKAEQVAADNLKNCKTIILDGIMEYQKWEYIRKIDGYTMIAEIGIVENCVYIKDWYYYRFAYPFKDEKEKSKLMREHIAKIKDVIKNMEATCSEIKATESVDIGKRLYWSNAGKCYADHEYTNHNN